MDPMTPEHLLEVAADIMEAAVFCFLITLHESGRANARLMQPFGPEEDMAVWLGASPESRKVEEILEDDRVMSDAGMPKNVRVLAVLVLLHN